jgi:hypothetical protein
MNTSNGYDQDEGAPTFTEAERQEHMRLALRAYYGRLPMPLLKKDDQPQLSIRTNRCRPIVDVGMAFLVGAGVQFTIKQEADSADEPAVPEVPEVGAPPKAPELDLLSKAGSAAQDALDACWRANKQALVLSDMATNGGIFGDAFLKIEPDGVVKDGVSYPRVVVLDPQQVSIEVDPDDCKLVIAYNICWVGKGADGKPVERRQRIERIDIPAEGDADQDTPVIGADEVWQIRNQIRVGVDKQTGDPQYIDVKPPLGWKYAWCPIHHAPNLAQPNYIYGSPDLTTDIIELQRALNFALSNRNAILYFSAHPQPWATGVQPHEMQMSPGQVIVFMNPDAKLQNLEISGAGLAELARHIEDIRTDMDELSGVPSVAVGRIKDLSTGNLPGVTVRMLFTALLTKTSKKRETYGDMLASLCSHLLEMLGQGIGLDIEIGWHDVLPTNLVEWSQIAPVLSSMGVSEYTILQMVDIDRDAEAARKQKEQAESANPAMLAMANFDAGTVPGAAGMMPGAMPGMGDGAQQGPSPAAAAAGLQHPAMQQARVAAVSAAGGE